MRGKNKTLFRVLVSSEPLKRIFVHKHPFVYFIKVSEQRGNSYARQTKNRTIDCEIRYSSHLGVDAKIKLLFRNYS